MKLKVGLLSNEFQGRRKVDNSLHINMFIQYFGNCIIAAVNASARYIALFQATGATPTLTTILHPCP